MVKSVYSDIRRFGEIRNIANYESYPPFLEIAPEPFDKEAMIHYLSCFDINKYANKPIKQMILDHKVIAVLVIFMLVKHFIELVFDLIKLLTH